eukprot:m.17770 g.17770  ORF g.17770 m.17770 type:complete len:74 (+) comp10697_c0_seq11:784-1005(+)
MRITSACEYIIGTVLQQQSYKTNSGESWRQLYIALQPATNIQGRGFHQKQSETFFEAEYRYEFVTATAMLRCG